MLPRVINTFPLEKKEITNKFGMVLQSLGFEKSYRKKKTTFKAVKIFKHGAFKGFNPQVRYMEINTKCVPGVHWIGHTTG